MSSEDIPLIHQKELLNYSLNRLNRGGVLYRIGLENVFFERDGCEYFPDEIVFFVPEYRILRCGDVIDLHTLTLETLKVFGQNGRELVNGSIDMTCGRVFGIPRGIILR